MAARTGRALAIVDLVSAACDEVEYFHSLEGAASKQAYARNLVLVAVDTAGVDLVYDAVTTTAADVLGVDGHRLVEGGNADLVVHHHRTLREVVSHHEAPAHVIASGRLVASSASSTTFHVDVGVS